MSKDLALDPDIHDLLIQDFDLVLVNNLESIRQALSVRLQYFYGEWFLDNTEGVKYYEYVFIKNYNLNLISSIMKTIILNTSGVNEVLEYFQEFNQQIRKLMVDFIVDTDFGITRITETIGV